MGQTAGLTAGLTAGQTAGQTAGRIAVAAGTPPTDTIPTFPRMHVTAHP
jgi:hypothetical protein